MKTYKKKIDIPSIKINKDFFSKLKNVYLEEKNKIKELKLNISLEDDSEEITCDNFDDLEIELESSYFKVNSVTIRIRDDHFKEDHFVFYLLIDKKGFHSCYIESGKKDTVRRVKENVENIFKKFKTSQNWIYVFWKIPLGIINLLIAGMFTVVVYNIFKNTISNPDLFFMIWWISGIIFYIISNKTIRWLFPIVEFELENNQDKVKKWIKGLLGTILVGLVINTFSTIIKK